MVCLFALLSNGRLSSLWYAHVVVFKLSHQRISSIAWLLALDGVASSRRKSRVWRDAHWPEVGADGCALRSRQVVTNE